MRLITRTLGAVTVAAAMMIAPLFSRLVVHPVREAQETVVEAAIAPADVLPANWPAGVFRHLRQRPVPMEEGELQALLGHVNDSARRFGLDPLTVLAVVQVESGFDPWAVSPAGAMGLMQLRVDTAREVASRLRIPWSSDEQLFDPELNVLLGTCYLRQLIDRFEDTNVALAAFHAGPNRIASGGPRLGSMSIAYTGRVWNAIVELYKTARV